MKEEKEKLGLGYDVLGEQRDDLKVENQEVECSREKGQDKKVEAFRNPVDSLGIEQACQATGICTRHKTFGGNKVLPRPC